MNPNAPSDPLVFPSNRKCQPPIFLPILVSSVLMTSAACSLAAGELSPAERLLKTPRPLVIGHRGYNAFAPENTLPSFKLAKAAGADLVELDYHLTKDDVPIVIHDHELDRTTDAVGQWGGKSIRVDSRTAAELQRLDAGKWFDPKYAGTRLPLLAEALDFIQADGGVTLIERKTGDAGSCTKFLRERRLINQVVLQSFDWTFLRDFHGLTPEQVLGALGPPGTRGGRKLTDAEKVLGPDWIEDAKKVGARIVVWNNQVTREAIAYAHGQSLRVWVYTINDPVEASRLLDLGMDGIITDNMSLIWRTMALRRSQENTSQ